MSYKWSIIYCKECGKVHAMPIKYFRWVCGMNYGGRFDVSCPYCEAKIYIDDKSKLGSMNADRGILIEKSYILVNKDEEDGLKLSKTIIADEDN